VFYPKTIQGIFGDLNISMNLRLSFIYRTIQWLQWDSLLNKQEVGNLMRDCPFKTQQGKVTTSQETTPEWLMKYMHGNKKAIFTKKGMPQSFIIPNMHL